jgi:hypothetical protein
MSKQNSVHRLSYTIGNVIVCEIAQGDLIHWLFFIITKSVYFSYSHDMNKVTKKKIASVKHSGTGLMTMGDNWYCHGPGKQEYILDIVERFALRRAINDHS